jgi:hypothetical protein
MGLLVSDVPSELSLTPPQENNKEKNESIILPI